jgi:hypothetical protein
MDREYRTFREHAQFSIGDDGRYLDDAIDVGIEACHLEVDPD